jgi:hypothetical protein
MPCVKPRYANVLFSSCRKLRETVSESLRVLIEHLLNKRFQLQFADRDSWQELATYADEHGYDLLLVNLTQTIDHNRAGRTLGEMTAEEIVQVHPMW